MRMIRCSTMCILTILCAGAPALVLAQSTEGTTEAVTVPFVYEEPSLGHAQLKLDFGAPFQKNLPTVLVIADGQQYYVRPGAMKALQETTFGTGVNVVGIVTRGTTPSFIKASLDSAGKADWQKAWRIFNSHQWIEDIESARITLVGENGSVFLYGRSGGAYLVHAYLTKYGAHVSRAFTQSAVNPYLNARSEEHTSELQSR